MLPMAHYVVRKYEAGDEVAVTERLARLPR